MQIPLGETGVLQPVKSLEERSETATHHRWAVVLAGGDGTRLLPLTGRLSVDDRPRQFCRVLGTETLLGQTLRSVQGIVSPRRTCSIVTKAHESFYRDLELGPETPRLLVQPLNRGTGPAIVYSLLRLQKADPDAVVCFLPSDHHFSDDAVFGACLKWAFSYTEANSDAVVLLGISPDRPVTSCDWIEPGMLLMSCGRFEVSAVRRFWEKPSLIVAADLMARGCLWNSMILIGRVRSFVRMVRQAAPDLWRAFEILTPVLLTEGEGAAVIELYKELAPSCFSTSVLQRSRDHLAVLSGPLLEWTDAGEVPRALSAAGRKRRLSEEEILDLPATA